MVSELENVIASNEPATVDISGKEIVVEPNKNGTVVKPYELKKRNQ